MSEPVVPSQKLSLPAVAQLVADAVLATPGVVRIEPSLSGALRHLTSLSAREPRSPVDGVKVAVDAGLLTIAVDVSVRSIAPALDIVSDAQHRVAAALADHHLSLSRIDLRILSVEPPDRA